MGLPIAGGGTYRPNDGNVRRWLASDGDLRQALTSRADTIAAAARALAPVDTGRYKASVHTSNGQAWDGRMSVDVVAGAPYSGIVELRQHVLKRAAGAG